MATSAVDQAAGKLAAVGISSNQQLAVRIWLRQTVWAFWDQWLPDHRNDKVAQVKVPLIGLAVVTVRVHHVAGLIEMLFGLIVGGRPPVAPSLEPTG